MISKQNFGVSLPKMAALQGSLQPEWKKCGKSVCRCAGGDLHGPYFYRRWREDGRQRKVYVPSHQRAAVEQDLEEARSARAPMWAMRQVLTELRRLEKEIVGCRLR